MSTTPNEHPRGSANQGECPKHGDLLKYKSIPDALSEEVRAKIAAHVPGCIRCTEFCGRADNAVEEGADLVQSLPEDGRLVELADTTPDGDWRMLSAIIEKCADLLRMDISGQYAMEALTSLTHREKLPSHLLARIQDVCEEAGVTIE